MEALSYRITKFTIPNWTPFHQEEPRGIAYETPTHFVHFFGKDRGLWPVSAGLTTTQAKTGDLHTWVEATFGAEDIERLALPVGHTIQGVWRPGLWDHDEATQGLSTDQFDLRLSEQALLLLIQRLDDLLSFIEPSPQTLGTFGHRARELLILACTEVENTWASYLRLAGLSAQARTWTTNDYVRLAAPLCLSEYQVTLPRYVDVPALRPFAGWQAANPSRSLPWYDAYNKTKHDRQRNFSLATLLNCLQAVAANLALFCVKFGPLRLFASGTNLSAFVNTLFTLELRDCSPSTFYAPPILLPHNQRPELICYDGRQRIQPRTVIPLTL